MFLVSAIEGSSIASAGKSMLDGVTITFVDDVAATAQDVIPYGIGIMAIVIGVTMIPKLIYKFV